MTAHPPLCKVARSACRSSTGHGGVRPNVPLSSSIRRRHVETGAVHHPFSDCTAAASRAAPAQTQSASSPAALKSP